MTLNKSARHFLVSFANSFTSNLISMSISFLITLITPKFFGIKEFSYWQLYYFYVNYVGIFHFGWNDGIYLRYGGHKYGELDTKKIHSEFVVQFIVEVIIAIIINTIWGIYGNEQHKSMIVFGVSIALVLTNIRFFLIYFLQATYRIKEYSRIIITDRACFFVGVCFILWAGINSYFFLILADLLGRTISLILAMYYCKEIAFTKGFSGKGLKREIFENISVGYKLLVANFTGLLIVGIVKQGIEASWSIETFGKISLMISISNIFIAFINTIGIVAYPVLKKTSEEKLGDLFFCFNFLMTVIFLGLLLFYSPLQFILLRWLPQYNDSIKYIALLFPMFIYEGKMSLLYNTYLKVLRKEDVLMKINISVVISSGILTIITTQILKSVDLAVLSILILTMLRSLLGEVYLNYKFGAKKHIESFKEVVLTIAFVSFSWFLSGTNAVICYFLVYMIYLFKERSVLREKVIIAKKIIA